MQSEWPGRSEGPEHTVQAASTCPQEPCPDRLAQSGQQAYWTLLWFHRLYIQHPSM